MSLNHSLTIAIVGMGLIGGSLARALRQAIPDVRILGVDSCAKTCAQAIELNMIDATATLAQASAQADILILCVPVKQTESVLRSCSPYLQTHTIVTDVGSTKVQVITAAKAALGEKIAQFIPAHPIAGHERSGITAALVDLFQGKKTILCPLPENSASDLAQIKTLWESIGAQCHTLMPEQHDAVFSSVSHLPHLLAYAFATYILHTEDTQLKLDLAGSGFRDFTRIAAASPEIWKDIFLANRTALLKDISDYQTVLAQLKIMIEQNQVNALIATLEHAAQMRQAWQPSHTQNGSAT